MRRTHHSSTNDHNFEAASISEHRVVRHATAVHQSAIPREIAGNARAVGGLDEALDEAPEHEGWEESH